MCQRKLMHSWNDSEEDAPHFIVSFVFAIALQLENYQSMVIAKLFSNLITFGMPTEICLI